MSQSKSLNIAPFNSLVDYLKAIIVIKRLYCQTKNNLDQTYKCINELVTKLTFVEFNTFLSLVLCYPEKYTLNIIYDLTEFNQTLVNYCVEKTVQSDTIISPAAKCCFCTNNNNEDWFEFKSPQFNRDPILYRADRIGIIHIYIIIDLIHIIF